jgi:hypothetical protein
MKRELLETLYVSRKMSSRQVAETLSCSEGRVNYWLAQHGIPKRSISEAVYAAWNPNGDPFLAKVPTSSTESLLFGLGLGLYWGEGNKKNKTAVRLGNTDPDLIKLFMKFLEDLYGVKKTKFRFWLQIFSDMSPQAALHFWTKALGVSIHQFCKPTITPARGVGNYREKTRHGVVTVYVSNVKLRNLLVGEIEKLRTIS